MSYRLGQSAKMVAGIVPAAQSSGSENGLVINRLGFFDAIVHLKVGAATGAPTAQGVALQIQTGDAQDGSDMANVTTDTIAALTADGSEAELNLDLNEYKQYIRAVATITFTGGTSPTIPVAITVVLGNPVNIPV